MVLITSALDVENQFKQHKKSRNSTKPLSRIDAVVDCADRNYKGT